jgi:multiple sugar transport system substrate-binding protein
MKDQQRPEDDKAKEGALGNPSAAPLVARLSRRRFLRSAVAGAAAVASGSLLAACAPPGPARVGPGVAVPGQVVQLVYQDWRTDWFPPMAQQAIEQFHQTHPNIRVFFTLDPENLEEKMPQDFQAGIAADVFAGCCSFFPIWGQQGDCLDLRPYVEADLDKATLDDWDFAQYRSYFTPDGRQYGLPKYHGALALYYNRDIFDAKGVDYPDAGWDHQRYLTAMQLLQGDRNGDGKRDRWGSMVDISWERLQVHVNGWGGHFADPADPHHSLMGEKPSLDALEWLRARIWDEHVLAGPLDVQNQGTRQAFVAGKLAMVEDGSWALKDVLADATFRVGVAVFPAGPQRRATLATTDAFGIYARTRYPQAAWELMQFLISKDYGRAMAKAHLLQPARASLVEDWVGYIQAEYPDKAAGMDIAAFADGQRKGYSVIAETFADQAAATRLSNAAWQEIFTLGKAPVSQLVEVSRQIEAAQKGK